MIITGNIYKIRCMVGDIPQEPIGIIADTVEQAVNEAILNCTEAPGNEGKPVRVLSTNEFKLEDF